MNPGSRHQSLAASAHIDLGKATFGNPDHNQVGIEGALQGKQRNAILSRSDITLSSRGLDAWIPALASPPERTVVYRQPEHLIPIQGLFGTMGASQWMQHTQSLFCFLADKFGVSNEQLQQRLFNPKLPDGTAHTSEHARIEATHVAQDSVLLMGITADYASVGSMLEVGFLAARSALLSRKMITFVQNANAALGESVARARSLLRMDIDYIQHRIPTSFIHFPNALDAATHSFGEQCRFIEFLESGGFRRVAELLLPRQDIVNQVTISGSSTHNHSRERLAIMSALAEHDIHMFDTLVGPDVWKEGRFYADQELPQKHRSLVNTVLINRANSLGALKDVGLAVFRAIVCGTYAVIFFPETAPRAEQEPASTEAAETYERTRRLAVAHWNRMVADFPWVDHYVKFVNSPLDVAKAAIAICEMNRGRIPDPE